MLVLASASPRRQEILRKAGIAFTVRPAHVDETPRVGESPEEYVQRLAESKARAVWAAGDTVLGADTIVILDGLLLGKPRDTADAARMLRLLSGRRHRVLTGVCFVDDKRCHTTVEETWVEFLDLTDEEIAAYVAGGEPLDKAGAYAIQEGAAKFVRRIEGCYWNVVGLPLALVYRFIRSSLR